MRSRLIKLAIEGAEPQNPSRNSSPTGGLGHPSSSAGHLQAIQNCKKRCRAVADSQMQQKLSESSSE